MNETDALALLAIVVSAATLVFNVRLYRRVRREVDAERKADEVFEQRVASPVRFGLVQCKHCGGCDEHKPGCPRDELNSWMQDAEERGEGIQEAARRRFIYEAQK